MNSGSEDDVSLGLNRILESLAPGRFRCTSRKTDGRSVIRKPVDLEIRSTGDSSRVLLAVEVANVNTTQLVGEVCRLYYDSCPSCSNTRSTRSSGFSTVMAQDSSQPFLSNARPQGGFWNPSEHDLGGPAMACSISLTSSGPKRAGSAENSGKVSEQTCW